MSNDVSLEYEDGDEVRVTYTSERSRNEVSRSGVVTRVDRGGENPVVYVHVERHSALKHVYLVLTPTRLESGSRAVAALSVTVDPDDPPPSRPTPGSTVTVQLTASRTQFLGVVERIDRTDIDRNFIVIGGER